MMKWQEVLEAVVIAFGMASWPIIGKYSEATGPWVGFLVMSCTAVVLALLASIRGEFGIGSFPAVRGLSFLAVAGLLNGIAMYRYTIRTSGRTPTGKYVVLVAVLVVVEAPFIDLVLNKEWLSPRQWAGVVCGMACVYLLGPR